MAYVIILAAIGAGIFAVFQMRRQSSGRRRAARRRDAHIHIKTTDRDS